ncbi:MAG: site-2 protease family protein [Candidatus Woesearchaeota archaeon]
MDFQLVGAIVFVVVLAVLLYLYRSKLILQKVLFPLIYILMYKSRLGINFMNLGSKYPRFFRIMGLIGTIVGFIGMVLIAVLLIQNVLMILIVPDTAPAVMPVLPVNVDGVFYVPFFYWILVIIVIAAVHEFAHGIIARSYDIKIKSSGLAVVGLIVPLLPAAFVEPDEKQLGKRQKRQQLSVFSAGSFANVLLGLFAVLALFALTPVTDSLFDSAGVEITKIAEGGLTYPAKAAGMQVGEVITAIDGRQTLTRDDFILIMETKRPGDLIEVKTGKSTYVVTLAKNIKDPSKPYLGIEAQEKVIVDPLIEEKIGSFIPYFAVSTWKFFYWLFLLSIGIGLFNLLPLGPLDGGRMLLVALQRFFSANMAAKIWKYVSTFFFVIVMFLLFLVLKGFFS